MSGIPVVLAIGGSDSSGGSGLQADQRAVNAAGGHLWSAVTAVTAQGASGAGRILAVSPADVRAQIEAVMQAGAGPGAVKCGMLVDAGIVGTVADMLEEFSLPSPVIDPVITSTSGRRLIDDGGLAEMRRRLLPLALLVTPNIPEARLLTGLDIRSIDDMCLAATALAAAGPAAVLVKGGHLEGEEIEDVFYDGTLFHHFRRRRLAVVPRGTGCSLASAVAVRLASGQDLLQAVGGAVDFIDDCIARAATLPDGMFVITSRPGPSF